MFEWFITYATTPFHSLGNYTPIMDDSENRGPVNTEDERSRNHTGHRSKTALLPVQGYQRTPTGEPELHAYEMATMKGAKPKPSQRPQSVWSLWWMEILNCLLMIGMLCATIGVLYPNDGKPLPDLPYHVCTLVFPSMGHISPAQQTREAHT